jgi:dihydrofolate reductase
VDELRIVVCPVLLSAGTPYLRGVGRTVDLELAESKPYPKGAVSLTYRVSI